MFGLSEDEVKEYSDRAFDKSMNYTDRKQEVLKNYIDDKIGDVKKVQSNIVNNMRQIRDKGLPIIEENREDIEELDLELKRLSNRIEKLERISDRNKDKVIENSMDIEHIESSMESFVTETELDEDVKEHFVGVVTNFRENILKLMYKIIETRETEYPSTLAKSRLIEELDELGFSVTEIAIMLDITENSVRGYLD